MPVTSLLSYTRLLLAPVEVLSELTCMGLITMNCVTTCLRHTIHTIHPDYHRLAPVTSHIVFPPITSLPLSSFLLISTLSHHNEDGVICDHGTRSLQRHSHNNSITINICNNASPTIAGLQRETTNRYFYSFNIFIYYKIQGPMTPSF